MAGKQAPNRTTVNLTYLEDKASKPVRAVLGLRQVLSAGVRLFLQLAPEEQMKLVSKVMEDEKKFGPMREKEQAALLIFEQLPAETQEKALEAVKNKRSGREILAAVEPQLRALVRARKKAGRPRRKSPA